MSGCFGVLKVVISPVWTTTFCIGWCNSRHLFLLPTTVDLLSAMSSYPDSYSEEDKTSEFLFVTVPIFRFSYSVGPFSAIPLLLFQPLPVVWGCSRRWIGGEWKIWFVDASVRRMTPCVSSPCFPLWTARGSCYFTAVFCCSDDCCFTRS